MPSGRGLSAFCWGAIIAGGGYLSVWVFVLVQSTTTVLAFSYGATARKAVLAFRYGAAASEGCLGVWMGCCCSRQRLP